MYRTRTLAAVLLAASLAACSDSPSGDLSSAGSLENYDVAFAAADGVAQDIDVMAGMDGVPGTFLVSANEAALIDRGHPDLGGCTFANGSFTCPPVTRQGGLTVSRTITLLDANGQAQQAYDSITTASIHVVATVSGDVDNGPWTATVSRSRDFTVTGLAGTETSRTVNGSGSEQVTRVRATSGGETRSYELSGTVQVTNVVIPVRAPGVTPWPTSGTIVRTFTVTPANGTPHTRTVTITFDGTASATATVNGGDTFTLDLANRRAIRRNH